MNKYQEALDTLVKYAHESPNLKWVLIHEENIIQELVDKATPMKPKVVEFFGDNVSICPTKNCRGLIEEETWYKLKYCGECGQKLDWSEDDE